MWRGVGGYSSLSSKEFHRLDTWLSTSSHGCLDGWMHHN